MTISVQDMRPPSRMKATGVSPSIGDIRALIGRRGRWKGDRPGSSRPRSLQIQGIMLGASASTQNAIEPWAIIPLNLVHVDDPKPAEPLRRVS